MPGVISPPPVAGNVAKTVAVRKRISRSSALGLSGGEDFLILHLASF